MKLPRAASIWGLFLAALLFSGAAFAQDQSNGATQQSLPDAPAPNKPVNPFPANTAPAPKVAPRAPESEPPPSDNPPPMPPVATVPRGSAVPSDTNPEEVIRVNVSMVVVPVTVKDSSGHLVAGLTKNDFSIFENGSPERLALFTSDPFPLSVGVVLDSNLPDQTLRKVRATLPALVGAFSEYDEVGIFSYGNSVQQQLAFTGSPQQMDIAFKHAAEKGRTNGPPVVSGPMTGLPSPTVNGHPFDPSTPHVNIATHESAVLNDAILAAATALSQRDRARRKIIFVISDGREDGSQASYSDVLKVLLSNNISVYALAVDAGAIPGYRVLQGIHIPLFGYGDILGKYVSATAGESFAEFTQDSIENAYARITGEARNQYTLGYTTRQTAASDYRSIEVRVHRAGLDVRAKDGYYPLPPQR